MNPTLLQEIAATTAADRRRDGERAQAAGRTRRFRLGRRVRRAAAPAAPMRGLDPAPRG